MLPDSLYWEEIEEGDTLPSLVKDVTVTTVVYGAIASRDFMPGHHDRDFAQKCGLKDIYMNSPVTTGWASRYVTDWSGPSGDLKKISLRFGSPCFPGDALTWRGRVARKYIKDGQSLVDVELSATILETGHCTGIATIKLPTKA